MSFKGNKYDFSVDYNAIDKSDRLNIHKHLMVKNNKKMFVFIKKQCSLVYYVIADH